MTKTYTTEEACEIAGLSERVVRYWVSVGAVVPLVPPAGQGSHVRWTPDQVHLLGIMRTIRDHTINSLDLRFAFSATTAGEIWKALVKGESWSFSIDVDSAGHVTLLSSER